MVGGVQVVGGHALDFAADCREGGCAGGAIVVAAGRALQSDDDVTLACDGAADGGASCHLCLLRVRVGDASHHGALYGAGLLIASSHAEPPTYKRGEIPRRAVVVWVTEVVHMPRLSLFSYGRTFGRADVLCDHGDREAVLAISVFDAV